MKRSIFSVLFIVFCSSAFAQGLEGLSGKFTTRYMSTNNRRELADFSTLVSFGNLQYKFQAKEWLTFGLQVNGLVHYGIDNITTPDPITGAGPIYEANLWNPSLMSGRVEAALPQLYAKLNFGDHKITLGRFLQETPTINPEPWPFPNALQGLWYEFDPNDKIKVQVGLIHQISPRFSGRFDGIGETIGLVATGRDEDGNPSGYPGNVNSNFLAIGNLNWQINDQLSVDVWDYFTENVDNTFLLEPTLKLDGDVTIKAMFMYQFKVGEGGNENPLVTYQTDGHRASQYGLRVEKRVNQSTFQLNFSRISDEGRLSLPREWGREPFYTFQRRTRVEGFRDVTSIMARWKRDWDNDDRIMSIFTSIGGNQMPDVDDPIRNKLSVPSHLHWDADIVYTPKNFFIDGFSAELYIAYRFLNDEIGNNESLRINKADFFHTDFILSYTF